MNIYFFQLLLSLTACVNCVHIHTIYYYQVHAARISSTFRVIFMFSCHRNGLLDLSWHIIYQNCMSHEISIRISERGSDVFNFKIIPSQTIEMVRCVLRRFIAIPIAIVFDKIEIYDRIDWYRLIYVNIFHWFLWFDFAASPNLWPLYSHPYNGYFLPGCGFKRKGGQVRFTPQQTQSLERRFNNHKYLSPEDRKQLAAQLKLTDRQVGIHSHSNPNHFHNAFVSNSQVKTWFQNRRAKWRRCHPSHPGHEKDHHVTSHIPLNLQLEALRKRAESASDTFSFDMLNKWGRREWERGQSIRSVTLSLGYLCWIHFFCCIWNQE